MIKDVLRNLVPKVETAETSAIENEEEGSSSTAGNNPDKAMVLTVKNKLRYHSRNKLSIKQKYNLKRKNQFKLRIAIRRENIEKKHNIHGDTR